MIDIPVLLANEIIQSAGGDLYAQCRKILGKGLRRSGFSKKAVADLDATAGHLRQDPSARQVEVEQWVSRLRLLINSDPSVETELFDLHRQLARLLPKPSQSQVGFAARDQYNIGGNATFLRR